MTIKINEKGCLALEEKKNSNSPKLFKYQIQEILIFFDANEVLTKARCLSKYYHALVTKILPNWKFPSLKFYIPSEFISLPRSDHLNIIFNQTNDITIIID